MIDLHTHVLPGIDDGPQTLDASLALVDAALQAGIATLVATPHVSGRFPNDATTIERAAGTLGAALAQRGAPMELRLGAELALTHVAELHDEQLGLLALGRGPWLLVECPLGRGVGDFELLLRRLRDRGHRIVLAHPERSPRLQRDQGLLRDLVDDGMLCSITASSLTGAFGREARACALAMAREGLVHNVTSDAHDAAGRPPGIRAPVEAVADQAPELAGALEWLTIDVPAALLDGADPPPPPAPPRPRSGRRRLRLGRR